MKNKITFLIMTLITIISFNNTAYSQCTLDDTCSYPEIPSCDVSDAYPYFTVGVGPIIIIPNLGVGYRQRYTQFGWDTSLSASTVGYVHQLNAHLVGHYYLSPLIKNSTYVGLGVMGSGIFSNKKGECGTLSPDFVFGKQLERSGDRRHFLEMHVDIPTVLLQKHSEVTYIPLMYIKYGVSF